MAVIVPDELLPVIVYIEEEESEGVPETRPVRASKARPERRGGAMEKRVNSPDNVGMFGLMVMPTFPVMLDGE